MNRFGVVLLLSSLLTFACSHDDGGSGAKGESLESKQVTALAQSDRDAVATAVGDISNLPQEQQASATALFGGTTGSDLQHFIDDRIHFFLSQENYNDLLDNSFHGKFGSSSDESSGTQQMKSKNVDLLGVNVGIVLWLEAALNNLSDLPFNFRGQDLTLSSGRVGLMLIGDGYKKRSLAAVRQSVLVHEARHSDCPTGVTKDDLDTLTSTNVFPTDKVSCGNLHAICPQNHDYAGLPGCDKMAWGAYTAGALFAAMTVNSQTTYDSDAEEMARDEMVAVAADSLGRLLFDSGDMFDGKLGQPKSGSLGLVQ